MLEEVTANVWAAADYWAGLQVDELQKRLEANDIHDISIEHMRFALRSNYASDDVEKAMELLVLHRDSIAGTILPYDPNVHMLGAENRSNVTCYLDALLFAMFAKLEAFECMLKNDPSDEAQRNLGALIRLWVNMLRSGKLIHTDMVGIPIGKWPPEPVLTRSRQTQLIQNALAACGWREAQLLQQQDTSEAFAFITETLQLPLLPLQVDMFHQGKADVDDHKVVYERLLNLAVPADPEGKGVKLEDCMEEYFNTKVDVSRDNVEEKGVLTPRSTVRTVDEDEDTDLESLDQVDMDHLQRRWTLIDSPDEEGSASNSEAERASARTRSTSIIQRIVLDDEGKPTEEADSVSLLQKAKRKGSTVVKAITIPAWQFFRLIRMF